MTQIEKVLYSVRIRATGGRDGVCRSDDGRLDIKLSTPGTSGGGTNPEQLLAAGWSASFIAAMKIEAAKTNVTLPADVTVDAEVDLNTTIGGYELAARLNVTLPGIERDLGRSLVGAAQEACPYFRAMRGNVNVLVTVLVTVV